MAEADTTHDRHLGASEAGAVGSRDESLGKLGDGKVVGPAAEEGDGEECDQENDR